MDVEKPNLLIVDDELIILDLLNGLLKDNYSLSLARGGIEALEVAVRDPLPDLILLDCVMPDIDGMSVCRQLKQNPRTADIPILFLTIKDDIDHEVSGFEAGAVDYIHKPISPPKLMARIRTHLELSESHKRLSEQKLQLELLLEQRNAELEKTKTLALNLMENMVFTNSEEPERSLFYRKTLKENLDTTIGRPEILRLIEQAGSKKNTELENQSLDRESVITQLETILNSTVFANAERMRSLLKFVVYETLNGHANALKAFTIAVEVFQRDESFDPQQDPLIRVQAGNLRKRLEQYYITLGQNDAIIITIPKGGYSATFIPNRILIS
jgi:DNA-binding response OmpR family regulator